MSSNNLDAAMPEIFDPHRPCRTVSNWGDTTPEGIKAQKARNIANYLGNLCCNHALFDGVPGTMSATEYFAAVAKYFTERNWDISQLPTEDASLPADILPGTRGTSGMTLQQYHDYILGLLYSLPKF